MDRLLDLRSKSSRPLHKSELRHLVEVATATTTVSVDLNPDVDSDSSTISNIEKKLYNIGMSSEVNDDKSNFIKSDVVSPVHDNNTVFIDSNLIKCLEIFLKKVITSIQVDTDVWDILSELYEKLGRYRDAYDHRVKQVRRILT